ncbi:MAG: hypothetical protein N4P88_01500 [Lactobacillus iners]|nr:hypothetical protein [Lactobacillus iners]
MEDVYHAVDLKDNQFINNKTGLAMLPSLINAEDETTFSIKRDFFLKDYVTLRDSIKAIKKYEIADQYNIVLERMSTQAEYWLKFIGMFKSVQLLQLKRNARMFPALLTENGISKALKFLMLNGLIIRWKYYHPINGTDIPVYTLSGNGFRFLKYFYNEKYFNPQNFFNLDARFHLRFWEVLDVYQMLISLPVYHASSTMFKGYPSEDKAILPSPLQVNLELIHGQPKNLVFYPALHSDGSDYYKNAVIKWKNFVEKDDDIDLTKTINDLPSGQNVLTFYTPTLARANELNEILCLKEFRFPSLFLVGTQISNAGLPKAFFMPDRENNGLRALDFEDILKKEAI